MEGWIVWIGLGQGWLLRRGISVGHPIAPFSPPSYLASPYLYPQFPLCSVIDLCPMIVGERLRASALRTQRTSRSIEGNGWTIFTPEQSESDWGHSAPSHDQRHALRSEHRKKAYHVEPTSSPLSLLGPSSETVHERLRQFSLSLFSHSHIWGRASESPGKPFLPIREWERHSPLATNYRRTIEDIEDCVLWGCLWGAKLQFRPLSLIFSTATPRMCQWLWNTSRNFTSV